MPRTIPPSATTRAQKESQSKMAYGWAKKKARFRQRKMSRTRQDSSRQPPPFPNLPRMAKAHKRTKPKGAALTLVARAQPREAPKRAASFLPPPWASPRAK